MKSCGGTTPQHGIVPAHQGFQADDAPRPQIDLRLVRQVEQLLAEGVAKAVLELQPLGDLGIHLR
jgi:hypothetical protein